MPENPLVLLLPAALIGVWLAAALDWARTDVVDVRTLPKGGWAFTLLFFGAIGGLAWFIWGHPWDRSG